MVQQCKVNAVFGQVNDATNSPISNSCLSGVQAPMHWQYQIDEMWTPEEWTIMSVVLPICAVFTLGKSGKVAAGSDFKKTSLSAVTYGSVHCQSPCLLAVFATPGILAVKDAVYWSSSSVSSHSQLWLGQGCPPWPRWISTPSLVSVVLSKKSPFHWLVWWKRSLACWVWQHFVQNIGSAKQSWHLYVPSPSHKQHTWFGGGAYPNNPPP